MIIAQIQEDVAAKHAEVVRARQEHEDLEEKAARLSCTYLGRRIVHSCTCNRCDIRQRAAGMRVEVHEKLLPDDAVQQLAVTYDLCVPGALLHLTDALYLLHHDVCGSKPNEFRSESTWSEHAELFRWVQDSVLVK